MPTAGSIIQSVREIYGDPDRTRITDAIGLDWLNRAQNRFCNFVEPIDEIKDYTLTAKQPRFNLPTYCLIPLGAMWYKSRVTRLEYKPPDRWLDIIEAWPDASGTPDGYTVIRRQLEVGPQKPSVNSATALASGTISSTATTLGLTAASGTFRSKGWVIVDSEVIEYTGVSQTTLTGCVRGVHGTNNTTHSSNATVTEIDLQLLFRRSPSAITATTTSPEIPEMFHEYLEKYMLYMAWLARGDKTKAEIAYNEFEMLEKQSMKTVGRRSRDGILQIKDWMNKRGNWW